MFQIIYIPEEVAPDDGTTIAVDPSSEQHAGDLDFLLVLATIVSGEGKRGKLKGNGCLCISLANSSISTRTETE